MGLFGAAYGCRRACRWCSRCGHVIKVWWLQHFYERNYHNLSFKRIWQKKNYFKGCCWFKCINVRLVPDMTFKFYTSVAKGLKLSQKFSRTNCRVCRSYRAKTGRFFFAPILDRVKLWTSLEIDKNIILTRSLPICTAERLSHSCSLLTHSLITIHTDKILY